METRRRQSRRTLLRRCGHQTICFAFLALTVSLLPGSHAVRSSDELRLNNTTIATITNLNLISSTAAPSSSNSSTDIGMLEELESVLVSYVNDALDRNYNEILTGISPALTSRNVSSPAGRNGNYGYSSILNGLPELSEFDRKIVRGVARFVDRRFFSREKMARAVESGRLFFFKGLKKIVWPLLVGLQIVKTVLLVLFLPSIIGSLGKIVGKGLSSVSVLSNQPTTVEDLDFKDNSYNSDQDFNMNMDNNAYLPPLDAQPAGTSYNMMYDANNANAALSRLGFGGGRVTYVNTGNDYNRQQKRNDFKIFHDIPSSSLLLTNYDPFYSPLLSRLDAVFAQMGLSNKEENCREKLVCLMYANPAKYAPYSNLISAQLSRELNELRKPTNDNPDILRFFKYMRAAKDGQDGVDCERVHKDCGTYNDLSNPAMVTTFNDINKLVQARKL
ncbi:uncharacterized protein LOC5573637 [Aedes aegypti]|uniref:Protein osiris 24 n=1 Tax=Aedes aegypti TaxID=7159 RepID=A0A1S4FR62_AEDAE|nr:uncharacterized protein LOC5573637 [Aedes aegypti]XP_021693390.1 uncharacterized protein LOC5573637 [Aedes aegypti]XP_021693391.1 uncharacterized protein LOC5573637 [Aedes aegypti]